MRLVFSEMIAFAEIYTWMKLPEIDGFRVLSAMARTELIRQGDSELSLQHKAFAIEYKADSFLQLCRK